MKVIVVTLATVAAFAGTVLGQENWQPKVTVVEKGKLVHGSVSMDKGSPWCKQGERMVWLVGHDPDDHPSCEVSAGVWRENRGVTLPKLSDGLNRRDDGGLDRHDCKTIYANDDNRPDIICLIGANKGRGIGYNELFLTQPDGSLKKVLKHGLQKYITMRTRMMNTLRGPNGEQLVFISTRGIPRKDGRPNVHRMFRVTRGQAPYFVEVLHENGDPWLKHTVATSVKIGDINGDGLDDIIVTNEKDPAMMFIQNTKGFTFTNINMSGSEKWRAVRIADMNNDGISDLVVTKGYKHNRNEPWLVQVFKGTGNKSPPYFKLNNPIFELEVPFPAPDVEVLDVNGDGRNDLYVVQADEATNNYCGNQLGRPFNKRKWYGNRNSPPRGFVAPKDMAPDLLLVGQKSNYFKYGVVKMNHRLPGCGFLAERFGNDRTMILSHGEIARAGHNVVLTWPTQQGETPPPPVQTPDPPPVQTPDPPPVVTPEPPPENTPIPDKKPISDGVGPLFTVPFTAEALEYAAYLEIDNDSAGDCNDGRVDAWRLTGNSKNVCQSDCTIGWTVGGEYVEYDFETSGPMLMKVSARVASNGKRPFQMEIVDTNQLWSGAFAPGQGWNKFEDVIWWNVKVTAGMHTLRVTFTEGAMNLCSVRVERMPGT